QRGAGQGGPQAVGRPMDGVALGHADQSAALTCGRAAVGIVAAVIDPGDPGEAVLAFLSERHLATLTTMRADGSPHVVPVGFTYSPAERLVRVITFAGSVKAHNADRGGRAAVCQVDGGRWLTLEGTVRLATDPVAV